MSDSNQVTVLNPLSLAQCAIKTIIQDDNLNVLMFEQYLPKELFNELMVGKERVLKLKKFCDKCFSSLFQIWYSYNYLEYQVASSTPHPVNFCMDCIIKYKTKFSVFEYWAQITSLMKGHYAYWSDFLKYVIHSDIGDIMDWNFASLSLDQALVLKNYPHNAPIFCGNYVRVKIAAFTLCDKFWRIYPRWKEMQRGYNYFCLQCALISKKQSGKKFDLVSITSINSISSHTVIINQRKLLHDVIWEDFFWCKRCKRTPLFEITNCEYNDNFKIIDDLKFVTTRHKDSEEEIDHDCKQKRRFNF